MSEAGLFAPQGRLRLRPFAAGDEADVVRLHREPRVREHLVDDFPLHQPAQAARFVQRIQSYYRQHAGLGIWHASLAEGGGRPRFVGWFGLMAMSAMPGEVELGSRLLPEAWGSGTAMDGGERLLGHAFGTLGCHRVWGACHPDNRSARMCLLALGMRALEMAPYEGGQALHHCVLQAEWRGLQDMPRQRRLRRAACQLAPTRTTQAAPLTC